MLAFCSAINVVTRDAKSENEKMKFLLNLVLVCFVFTMFAEKASAETGRFQISAVGIETYFVIDTKNGNVYRCHKNKCIKVKNPKYHK